MAYVNLIDPASPPAAVQPTLYAIKGAFGVVPNMFKAVANSPAALASMWGSFGALGGGTLGARLGEAIAVAIANANGCETASPRTRRSVARPALRPRRSPARRWGSPPIRAPRRR